MKKKSNIAFGIDIGGSGIKGAPVDLSVGDFAAPRLRIPTPQISTPQAVLGVITELVTHFDLPKNCPVGVAFPAPILDGMIPSIANLDASWAGVNLEELLREALHHPVTVVNDADAAGYAEKLYGAAKKHRGLTLVSTLGTGIGSALIMNKTLVPNCELGHLEIDGRNAESQAADSARTRENLTWEQWAVRLQRYYTEVEKLFHPDQIVIGGGVSKHHQKFLPLLDLKAKVVPAKLLNAAGIIGAAALAKEAKKSAR